MPTANPFVAAPAVDTLHALLRATTAPAHAALEAALDLLRPAPSRERFAATLQGFHAFHAAWEPALAGALDDAGFCARRSRLPLIDADLRALAIAAPATPCAAASLLCGTRDAALGSLYVLEGSTLGGRVIHRHLRGAAWCPPGGLRYFAAHGDDSGPLWRETLAYIERRAVDRGRVVQAALQTFALLQRCLQPAAAAATA